MGDITLSQPAPSQKNRQRGDWRSRRRLRSSSYLKNRVRMGGELQAIGSDASMVEKGVRRDGIHAAAATVKILGEGEIWTFAVVAVGLEVEEAGWSVCVGGN